MRFFCTKMTHFLWNASRIKWKLTKIVTKECNFVRKRIKIAFWFEKCTKPAIWFENCTKNATRIVALFGSDTEHCKTYNSNLQSSACWGETEWEDRWGTSGMGGQRQNNKCWNDVLSRRPLCRSCMQSFSQPTMINKSHMHSCRRTR